MGTRTSQASVGPADVVHPKRDTIGTAEIELAGQRLVLRSDGLVHWPAQRTLLVADTHLGKDASFRAGGTPVPATVTEHDCARLADAVRSTAAGQLIVLGDLVHGPASWSTDVVAALERLRERTPGVELVLVRGNHDRFAGDPPSQLGWTCVDPGWCVAGLQAVHDPSERSGASSALAGHLHPAIRLSDPVGSLRADCFWLRTHGNNGGATLVLPAFGTFTGRKMAEAGPGDRVLAIGHGTVIEVGARARRARGRA